MLLSALYLPVPGTVQLFFSIPPWVINPKELFHGSQCSAPALPCAERRFMHGWRWLCGHREREWQPLWRVRMVWAEEDTGYYSPGGRISRCASVLGALVNHSAVKVGHCLCLKGETWRFAFHKGQDLHTLPECKVISAFCLSWMMRVKICANLQQKRGIISCSRNVSEEGMRRNGEIIWENSFLYVTHSKKYVEICEEREIEMKL